MMRKIILFGTGKYGLEALDYFGSDNVVFFADNNVNIHGSFISGIEVSAGQTAHGTGRHYIQYRHFDNPVYISDVFSAKQVSNKAGPVIIEKYKMQDVEEYFRVIEELEEKEITYYVYT